MPNAIDLVMDEYSDATDQFGSFASTHEGIAVIREEYLELEAEVFMKQQNYDMKKMEKEAIQLGAMAIRFLVDCCNLDVEENSDEQLRERLDTDEAH